MRRSRPWGLNNLPKDRQPGNSRTRSAPSSNRREKGGPETGRDQPQVTQLEAEQRLESLAFRSVWKSDDIIGWVHDGHSLVLRADGTLCNVFDAVFKACPLLPGRPPIWTVPLTYPPSTSPMRHLEDKWVDISLHVPGNDRGKLRPWAGIWRLHRSWGVGRAATISLLCWQPSACPWRNHSCPLSACVVKVAARAISWHIPSLWASTVGPAVGQDPVRASVMPSQRSHKDWTESYNSQECFPL